MRHPVSGAIYERVAEGRCRVVASDGRAGLFTDTGRWISGELREADLHFLNWVAGPQLESRDQARGAGFSLPPRGVPVPNLTTRAAFAGDRRKGKGMDLGLSGKKALVTASSRGIGLSIARTFADDGCDVAICARSEGG